MSNNSEKHVNSSPERHTFQAESSKKKLDADPDNESAKAMIDWYEQVKASEAAKLLDPEWQKDNLEYDLRSTPWICDKVKASVDYSKKLYAALCNNDFQKLDVMPILKDQRWSCSWRHAGGVLSDMLETGDYIEWYCSGNEGLVVDEIRKDLKTLGWRVIDE
jgi:hypothetical protein